MSLKHRFELRLIFDNEKAAHAFVAGWLDGGLDGGGSLDWDTCYEESDDWVHRIPQFLRIKGTGEPIHEE